MELIINHRKIFAFSDTHGMHEKLLIPSDTDVLICAGDAVEDDDLNPDAYTGFLDWLESQPGKVKMFIPGNHELSFDIAPKWAERLFDEREIIVGSSQGLIYGGITFNMLMTPDVPEWYLEYVQLADVVISHYPADMIRGFERISPDYFIHGHIHNEGGTKRMVQSTLHCNCSMYDELRRH